MSSRILAIALVFSLVSGAVLHTAFPHDHALEQVREYTHTHADDAQPTDAMWQALHTAVRGEDKKIFFSLLPGSIGPAPTFTVHYETFLNVGSFFGPPALFEALKRGILQYRAFT